jgi:hypothetical protein
MSLYLCLYVNHIEIMFHLPGHHKLTVAVSVGTPTVFQDDAVGPGASCARAAGLQFEP